jgi:hypothetical protein
MPCGGFVGSLNLSAPLKYPTRFRRSEALPFLASTSINGIAGDSVGPRSD